MQGLGEVLEDPRYVLTQARRSTVHRCTLHDFACVKNVSNYALSTETLSLGNSVNSVLWVSDRRLIVLEKLMSKIII